MNKNNELCTIRLPVVLKNKLRKCAETNNSTLSDIGRRAIENYIDFVDYFM